MYEAATAGCFLQFGNQQERHSILTAPDVE